jgi:uroporphyrinogen-III synthase
MSSQAPEPEILVTRPEPGATALAESLTACGWRPVLAPLTAIEDRAPEIPDRPYGFLLLTSPRAASRVPGAVQDLPAVVVGEGTRKAAGKAGLRVFATGREAADSHLVSLLPPGSEILHLTGAHKAQDLSAAFARRGCRYTEAVCYEAVAADVLPDAAKGFLASPGRSAITFLSLRAASIFAELTGPGSGPSLAGLTAFALSERIAALVDERLGFSSVLTPPREGLPAFVDFVCSRRP